MKVDSQLAPVRFGAGEGNRRISGEPVGETVEQGTFIRRSEGRVRARRDGILLRYVEIYRYAVWRIL